MKVVELGGGENPRYHPNVDSRPLSTVDLVADFEKPLPLPDNEYDLVYSGYCIEHISWRHVKAFVKEIYRILKFGGKAEIITANLLEQCKVATATKEWSEDISCTIFGGQEHEYGIHKCGFSPEYAIKLFREVGFQKVEVRPHPSCSTDMVIEAFKGIIDRRQWVLNRCKKGEKILDIGSADGWVFRGSSLEPYITSIDLDVYDLPNFIQMNAHDLTDPTKSFPDKTFDVAILGELLEHVDDPVKVLKGANRVAKRLLITVPDPAHWIQEYYPYETLEEVMKRRGKTAEQLAIESNPHAKKFYTEDDYLHLFHRRWYTQIALEVDLALAGITDYTLENLKYEGWAFFCVETKPELKSEITPKLKVKPKEKPKIGLISTPFLRTPPDSYGGLELIVANLGETLAEMGHDVTIFAANGSEVKGCKVVWFGEPKLKVQVDWLKAERDAYEVYGAILGDFDIIHGSNWFGFEYLAKSRNPKIKVCHTHHGGLNLEWWGRSKPPFKLNLIAISDWMRKIYEAQGFPAKFVYNGINLDRYPFKREKGDRLLFVGRIDKFKQPHVAIEVAKKLNMGLDIVGGTFIQDPAYLEQIRRICDGEQIKFYPDTPHELKIRLMQNAKCLLFPSAMGEPFGLVPVEAMASGTPVVALNDGAVEEVVKEGGIVCDVFHKSIVPNKGAVYQIKQNPVEAMIEAVKKVDSIKPEDCRRNAERFSRENMAENYLRLYYEILEGNEW